MDKKIRAARNLRILGVMTFITGTVGLLLSRAFTVGMMSAAAVLFTRASQIKNERDM
ncbi:MAG: hypothetical protein IJ806_05650 [Ruminococcus sp.]|nr:hypothetical protein [Ruminococcus sp.]